MKRSLAFTIAALTLAAAPATAQEYLTALTPPAATPGDMQREVNPANYVLVTKRISVPQFTLPDDLQPGDEIPIEMYAVVRVDAAAPYLPARMLSIEIRDVRLANIAAADG